jgi:hypothetical protein
VSEDNAAIKRPPLAYALWEACVRKLIECG